ncbi:MAG: sortase [Chloroflexota bacterium]|nr:sortase [Chloroflexota bacterium]
MSRLVPVAGVLAVLLGAVLILRPAGEIVMAPSPTPTIAATAATAASAAGSPLATTARPSPTPLPPIPLGYRVQLPRLGIDLAILEGDIERDTVQLQTPENYAFHLPGTAIPGTGANSYLYAHARRGMFLSLWDAKIGDVVWISTPDGRALKYVVSEVHSRVPPEQVVWATPSAPDRLTLQTSTGPNPSDPRFVVVALPR